MGLLDELKKEADTLKTQEADRTQTLKANAAVVDQALRKTFHYMNDLFKQLNVVKPACPRVYDLPTVAKIDGLTQSDYRIDYRTSLRENSEHFENLIINFKRSKPEQFSVRREAEQIERFRDLLWQNNIRFVSEPFRNERRVVVYETFKINCEILCSTEVIGDYEEGVIRFKLRNVEDFGPTVYTLEPERITDNALEELAKLFIGKDSQFKEYNRRPSQTGAATGAFRAQPKMAPQYVVTPDPAKGKEEEQKKSGLLGSIKSVLNKPII
ncbi:MAG: hypothetical protein HY255_02100 [Betaproteobacteria bacterium]|nr:hypothetical protein [Betaproteobacteria bacterium]